MARRHQVVRRGVSQKRSSTWLFIGFAKTTLTAAGGTIIAGLNAAALALRPFTIVRTHIQMLVSSDQAAAIEFQMGALGIEVVSEQASVAGVAAVPTPVTQMGSEFWLAHQVFMGDESNITDRTRNASHFAIDSKAMRKVTEAEDVLIVAEFDATGGGMDLFTAGRMLIKLH